MRFPFERIYIGIIVHFVKMCTGIIYTLLCCWLLILDNVARGACNMLLFASSRFIIKSFAVLLSDVCWIAERDSVYTLCLQASNANIMTIEMWLYVTVPVVSNVFSINARRVEHLFFYSFADLSLVMGILNFTCANVQINVLRVFTIVVSLVEALLLWKFLVLVA